MCLTCELKTAAERPKDENIDARKESIVTKWFLPLDVVDRTIEFIRSYSADPANRGKNPAENTDKVMDYMFGLLSPEQTALAKREVARMSAAKEGATPEQQEKIVEAVAKDGNTFPNNGTPMYFRGFIVRTDTRMMLTEWEAAGATIKDEDIIAFDTANATHARYNAEVRSKRSLTPVDKNLAANEEAMEDNGIGGSIVGALNVADLSAEERAVMGKILVRAGMPKEVLESIETGIKNKLN